MPVVEGGRLGPADSDVHCVLKDGRIVWIARDDKGETE